MTNWLSSNLSVNFYPINMHVNGAYWSCGWNVGSWMQWLTIPTPDSVCCVLEQDTLSALLQ